MDDSISEKSRNDSSAERFENANGREKADRSLTGQHVANPQDDKRINRKFDLHIIPILFGLWLFAFIDRANIGECCTKLVRRLRTMQFELPRLDHH